MQPKGKMITGKDVLRQLGADLIGKDSYRGVTLTYSWLANQFGHISLGFIPTFILYKFLIRHAKVHYPAYTAAIIISVTWLFFETYNFLGPLLLKRQSESKLLFVQGLRRYIFRPAWGNIAFDTLTDLCFFWFGAFGASILLQVSMHVAVVLTILTLVLVYPCCYWFLTKMYEQNAEYPFQFRLSQWDGDIGESDRDTVVRFRDSDTKGKHMLVFGGRRSGKTSLSVGLSTEMSIRHGAGLYTTAMKLYNLFSLADSDILNQDKLLWTWRMTEYLVIDDINPGDPITEELVNPEKFLQMLDTNLLPDNKNRKILASRNVIWVMGNPENRGHHKEEWKQMLIQIGVPEADIYDIDLGYHFLP